jgi:hypothetical protein
MWCRKWQSKHGTFAEIIKIIAVYSIKMALKGNKGVTGFTWL